MTIFTSGTQARDGRTVNHDPKPWARFPDGDAGPRCDINVGGWLYWNPRPEFAVEDNPILASFRRAVGVAPWGSGKWTDPVYVASRWIEPGFLTYDGETPEQIDHARRVLAKLAALA